jgi:tRNA (guanine-N7-)-methyltransferase
MIFQDGDVGPLAVDHRPDWDARFGAAARRVELEIGSGHGGFALAFGARHPDRALVAIEQRRKFAADVAARAERRELANVLVLHGDARLLAPRLFAPGTLAAIHVHFPDPWWKRRHHRRRLVDDGLSTLLLRLLRPGGVLDFRTDVEGYAREAVERLEAAGFANPLGPGRFAPRDDDEIPSTRERRYLETGQPVWRLRLVRSSPSAPRTSLARRPAAE